MVVSFEKARLIECRRVVGQDGTAKTYGKLYAAEGGESMAFSTELQITDDITNEYRGTLDIKMGTGKNGSWASCKLLTISRCGK